METITMIQIAGFAVCFILLFVFIAKYRGSLEEEQETQIEAQVERTTVSQEPPTFTPRASLLQSIQGPAALEVADLKEQVKMLHYRLEELKTATQKKESDLMNQLSRLEARMATFEQEYVNKLQPTLLRVIDELEHIKGKAPQEVARQPIPVSKSPIPELPEEELKF